MNIHEIISKLKSVYKASNKYKCFTTQEVNYHIVQLASSDDVNMDITLSGQTVYVYYNGVVVHTSSNLSTGDILRVRNALNEFELVKYDKLNEEFQKILDSELLTNEDIDDAVDN